MIEQAVSLLADGFMAIRLQRGGGRVSGEAEQIFEPRLAIAEAAHWLVRAREKFGNGPVRGVDFHHRLSLAEAASFCHKMPHGTLDFLEEPIRDETPEAYKALRRLTDIPFALGEEFASKWQALPYVERGITQYIRLDICNIGEFTESMKVAGWCEAHYVDLFPHNPLGPVCTAASIQVAAAVPNFAWLEYNLGRFRPAPAEEEELFLVRPKPVGPYFDVPDTPGIGIEVNEAALLHPSFRFWSPPTLRRRDGSLTNR